MRTNPIRLLVHDDGEPESHPEYVHATSPWGSAEGVLCTGELFEDGESLGTEYVSMPRNTKITCPKCIEIFMSLYDSFNWPGMPSPKRKPKTKTGGKNKPIPATQPSNRSITADNGCVLITYHGDDIPCLEEDFLRQVWEANKEVLSASGVSVSCVRTGDRATYVMRPYTYFEGLRLNY